MKQSKLLPPTYFFIFLLLTIGLHFIVPIMQLIFVPYRFIGILLLVIGIWLNMWADGLFKRKNTTVKPFEKSSALILEGPFRFSPHPMYLGMVIALLNVAIIHRWSAKQAQAVRCYLQGFTQERIASELGISKPQYKYA